ncbi:hypothetical protein [Paenibacillus harenae]|uniref:hypothetical protein n=1 Tax=Paenibacillus harenae TaxID=306543 RepID=UPI000491F763|nr:hypothetical protein [Paenibacillus harenae]
MRLETLFLIVLNMSTTASIAIVAVLLIRLAFGETGVRERVNNVLRFKEPKRWIAAFSAVACIIAIAACAANPTVNEMPKETGELYGSYGFEKQVYMNPLSSFIATEGYEEYYTLTENALILTDEAGNQQKMEIVYERITVDEHEYKNSFLVEGTGVPDISSYKGRYQYALTDPSVSPAYRLYLLDGEIWLAKVHKDAANVQKNEYFWNIFKIKKLDGELPVKSALVGAQEEVDAFLALQKDFESGYDTDTCYNITPEYVRENSDYMIFKYNTSSASFLLYEGKVYSLGEWFGGFGVTSMALADLDSDGRSELYFTYSWGSGLHRSHAAYFNPAAKQIVTLDYTHTGGDMLLTDNHDGSLSLFTAAISNLDCFVNFDIEGTEFISDIVFANGQISLNADL